MPVGPAKPESDSKETDTKWRQRRQTSVLLLVSLQTPLMFIHLLVGLFVCFSANQLISICFKGSH